MLSRLTRLAADDETWLGAVCGRCEAEARDLFDRLEIVDDAVLGRSCSSLKRACITSIVSNVVGARTVTPGRLIDISKKRSLGTVGSGLHLLIQCQLLTPFRYIQPRWTEWTAENQGPAAKQSDEVLRV